MKIKKRCRPGVVLLILAGSVLLLSCWNGRTPAVSPDRGQKGRKSLIWIVTDIHYLSEELYDDGPLFTRMNREGDGKNTAMLDSLLSAFLSEIERERPAVLLVTGDLTFHGEKQSHLDLADFFSQIEETGTEVFVIPGNHDLNNPWAREYRDDQAYRAKYIDPDGFKVIYEDFGYSGALAYDDASLSYLIEPFPGLRILMLDSNKYLMNEDLNYPQAGGALSVETRAWIREQAVAARGEGCGLIAAMHHSLIEHNAMVSRGYTVDDSENLIPFFSSLGMKLNLSGHIHIQDIVETETTDGTVYDIATGAFSVYPHGYGTLIPEEGKWTYRSRGVDVEGWAADSGAGEERLLTFSDYSRDYFADFSSRMVYNVLEGYGPETAERIAAAAETLNLNFFAGREVDNPEGIAKELNRDFNGKGGFLQGYLNSIVADTPPADTILEIRSP
jgi:3',5'-cyclic AMP phosphodiesterase CpdA